jgi:hypothetical protein
MINCQICKQPVDGSPRRDYWVGRLSDLGISLSACTQCLNTIAQWAEKRGLVGDTAIVGYVAKRIVFLSRKKRGLRNTHICRSCGRPFTRPLGSSRTTCSDICAAPFVKSLVLRNCIQCGELFARHGFKLRTVCWSSECVEKQQGSLYAKYRKHSAQCHVCSGEYIKTTKNCIWCSDKCRSTLVRRSKNIPKRLFREKSRTCTNCGSAFQPSADRGKRNRKTCSDACLQARKQAASRKRWAPWKESSTLRNAFRGALRANT